MPLSTSALSVTSALVAKLEHATNVLTVTGKTPTHKTSIYGGKVESVPTYTKAIVDFNEDIAQDLGRIAAMQEVREKQAKQDGGPGERETGQLSVETASAAVPDEGDVGPPKEKGSTLDVLAAGPALLSHTLAAGPVVLSQSVVTGATMLKALIVGENGAPRDAAFVSFTTLAAANLARQAVHNQEPWFCVPHEPPMPEHINWKNVGKAHTTKQIGELISLWMTVALCIFWTIPVAFVSSLSNVGSLTKILPFLKEPVENNAWLSETLALVAPLLLVAFVSLLPYIILAIIKFEGHIEIETMQHPSLFSKLAAFTIVQTFFIPTIAGALSKRLQQIITDPTSAIQLFAQALPAQSAFFIQFIVVQNLLPLGVELLRVVPVVLNVARQVVSKIMGHNLTEKECNDTFLGLRSLDNPQEFYFGQFLGSKIILLQMVLYVYGCMSPLTSYFTLLVFGLLAIGLRHQLIYVYPPAIDSGGKLWMQFQRTSIVCAIVSEIALCVILSLKAAYVAAIMLFPLIVVTIYFDLYLKRRHYSITSYLPLGECAAVDRENESEGVTHEWLKDAYLQPALKGKYALRVLLDDGFGQAEETISKEDKAFSANDDKEKQLLTLNDYYGTPLV